MSYQQPYPPPQQPVPPAPKKSHTGRNVAIAIVGMFVALVGVIAFAGTDTGTDATKSTSETTTEPTVAPTGETWEESQRRLAEEAERAKSAQPPAVPETTEPPEDPGVAKIGAKQWFTYEDGLQVQVTKARPYKIGQYAAGGKPGGQGVVVTVTMRNGTAAAFDTALVQVELASGPNGTQAEKVYDSSNVDNGFEGSIARGRNKTATFAFAVPKAHLSQLSIEVIPSFEHDGAIFEGAAAK
jgi:hypothetical protein